MSDDRLRMTPGPTEVPAPVRERLAEPTPNPDVEDEFLEFYQGLTEKLEAVYGSDDLAILSGEGILGLEAAVASLIEPGDRVLCLANGIYGEGFAGFVEAYGGEAVVCAADWAGPLDLAAVEAELEDGEFAAATMVHCETPTGVLNDLEPVLGLLAEYDVVSVVDAVSSLGGTPVPTEHIDVCIGATQKCFSAPPGLTVLSVSDRAWDRIEATETRSNYLDLEPWKTALEEEWFPYTMPTATLYALDTAIDLLREEGLASVFERHETCAQLCRDRTRELGLEFYPDDETLCSPTVTALEVEGRARELQERIDEEHDVVLATGLSDLEDDVLRIGHMGHNARVENVDRTMDALEAVLE
ncbi:pyridoxal-phosphate-dependent aminotransferase family protein [Natrialbaceae archaeon AArc-T1-2]|uniref:pyridoxal-phosphate-dependent aminotransferase family protein n=1 Tax=Natrialbaceae archaeon AArc-T1-2 TaxID=3053904 RepID=UPI00255AA86D|nr:alanine--glyoxylate aminotransferase family protein [Natrialbaceae archaeon AArc-T1-2]WIV65711.1 alanine--glyoxylate aminotransferase family protein [Natrialbaceae archaeon AArc-T1-2]